MSITSKRADLGRWQVMRKEGWIDSKPHGRDSLGNTAWAAWSWFPWPHSTTPHAFLECPIWVIIPTVADAEAAHDPVKNIKESRENFNHGHFQQQFLMPDGKGQGKSRLTAAIHVCEIPIVPE